MRVRVFYALLMILSATVAATAQETLLWKNVNGWMIRVENGLCYMATVYTDGTVLRLGGNTDVASDGALLYVAVGNANWSPIEDGKEYPITFDFDAGRSRWTDAAEGMARNGFYYLRSKTSRAEFLDDVRRMRTLQIYFENRRVLNLKLDGSGLALKELAGCQNYVDRTLEAATQPKDPFAPSTPAIKPASPLNEPRPLPKPAPKKTQPAPGLRDI